MCLRRRRLPLLLLLPLSLFVFAPPSAVSPLPRVLISCCPSPLPSHHDKVAATSGRMEEGGAMWRASTAEGVAILQGTRGGSAHRPGRGGADVAATRQMWQRQYGGPGGPRNGGPADRRRR
uniref:Uncharacterized protein n=1 Tax=Arundo donax TaxID=35708 RepID=A0A0A8XXN9_ARUDO